ncbi:hypothetical protein PHMEG_00033040, partial [Phytophthora megakarya]
KELKAPDSDAEDHDERTWTEEELAQIFYKKDLFAFLLEDPVMKILRPMLIEELHGPTTPPTKTSRQLEAVTQLLRTLKDAGIMPVAFSASELFDLETTVIHRSATLLYNNLEPLVESVALPETIKRTPVRSSEYQTGSSQYASATSEAGSDGSVELEHQAPDSEKCLVLGDLLTGPARNWYRQLSRSTRSNWKSLLEAFQTQYCGRGVSVARQYYHAKKRSDESPMEYLHRLNVAGMRARLQMQIKDSPAAIRREHVEHFIETLDDRDLADQLALLRLTDADDLEENLRARQRAKARQGKAHAGSNKFRQKSTPENQSAPTKNARAVRAIQKAEDSSESESDASGSEQEDECRRVYLAESKERGIQAPTPAHQDNPRPYHNVAEELYPLRFHGAR